MTQDQQYLRLLAEIVAHPKLACAATASELNPHFSPNAQRLNHDLAAKRPIIIQRTDYLIFVTGLTDGAWQYQLIKPGDNGQTTAVTNPETVANYDDIETLAFDFLNGKDI